MNFVRWNENEVVIDNGFVKRTISISQDGGSYLTTCYEPNLGKYEFMSDASCDFEFTIDKTAYSGRNSWIVKEIKDIEDEHGGSGVSVLLDSTETELEVEARYLMYEELPVIRKNLVIKNKKNTEVRLENVDVEKLHMIDYFPPTFSWIYNDYGRRKSIGPFEGTMQDSLVVVHNMNTEAGILVGNEASGVMKHISVFSKSLDLCAGLTHMNAKFPFRKYLAPGEQFVTPQVFTMVYNNERTPDRMLNKVLPDFIRKHMGIRLSAREKNPTFVYNTWEPFFWDISEPLLMEVAKSAAEAGIKEFVIDDGWEDELGDWGYDKEKFPNGLKPLFEYIKSLGMTPGLWVSVGSASSKSKVVQEHPEWFIKDNEGNFVNIHVEDNSMDICSACFSTGWKDYIKGVLLRLIEDYGLEYLKLDFAIVTSAYRYNSETSGCCAKNHNHKDRRESMNNNYEYMWQLFDELHEQYPNLFIDCTFEAMGGLQLVDYALVKHAEGDWLSNFFGDEGDKTDLRIRNMAWWRSPAIPATALVIGNAQMQDPDWEMHMKSLAGALPMVLGDPRKLSIEEKDRYRFYGDWITNMEEKYHIMNYRQDLFGFGEPMEGSWDGFQRINTDTQDGGIIGIFRHGAMDERRIVTVQYLDKDKMYNVCTMEGKILLCAYGKDLEEKGFEVHLTEKYAGELYEIALQ